ncbi:MAG: DUF5125 domain-containing protein [Prevotellaceae bacterium]|jgi:hypothetical protein|nr:DUF5125 domain-containing protein [Prevotellaceae bacterium]
MKKYIYLLMTLIILNSCSKDEVRTLGNPVFELRSELSGAMFGDSLQFTVSVNDEVPLSTLKAKLYFGEESVSETVIRTKNTGDYTGKIYVPFYKDIPDETATLEFILQNTSLTVTKKTYDVALSRPDYPYLILVTRSGMYPMEKKAKYQYAATEMFPNIDLPSYIKTPIISEWGNEITFGWGEDGITQGSTADIPFVSSSAGKFSVTFNTLTYEASPFFEILINSEKMNMIDKQNFRIDLNLTQGQDITVEGIDNIAEWWIDADFFTKVTDSKFTFTPITGKYRIIANTTLKYFKVEAMLGDKPAQLQPDGTGAIWIIGDGVGKPSITANHVGWTTEKAICMAPAGGKKYQITLVAEETVNAESINFKFFYQNNWSDAEGIVDGGEYKHTTLTTDSDIVFVGDGATPDYNGDNRDSGNLGLLQALEAGATYVFTVDVSAGRDAAVLTVTKQP